MYAGVCRFPYNFPMVQRSGGGGFQEETETTNPFNRGENQVM